MYPDVDSANLPDAQLAQAPKSLLNEDPSDFWDLSLEEAISIALNNSRAKWVEVNARLATVQLKNEFWQAMKNSPPLVTDPQLPGPLRRIEVDDERGVADLRHHARSDGHGPVAARQRGRRRRP